jgi:L-ascorbate metabolism protein UlaG (beta-lactamase superfamily)
VRLTKYSHSCIRLDDDGRSLVIDPGVLSEAAEALEGADAVLITHEHPDHLDADALRRAAAAHADLQIWAPEAVADSLADLGGQVTASGPGESFQAAGFAIETFGGQHAMIHPSVPVIANLGYIVQSTLFHPGDSFTVPTKPVQTLCVPVHAPWSKVAEVIDYVVSVRAPQAVQIHDGLLNETGLQFTEAHVTRVGGWYGSEFRHLGARESLTL